MLCSKCHVNPFIFACSGLSSSLVFVEEYATLLAGVVESELQGVGGFWVESYSKEH